MRALRKHLEKIYRKLAMKMVQKADAARSSEDRSDGPDGAASTTSDTAASGGHAPAALSGDQPFAVSDAESALITGSVEEDPSQIEAELTEKADRSRLKKLAAVQLQEIEEDNALSLKEYEEAQRKERLEEGEESGGNESDNESDTASSNAGQSIVSHMANR